MSNFDKKLKLILAKASNKELAMSKQKFFRIDKGHYAEGDEFNGITVPELRKIAKQFLHLPIYELKHLLVSKINEERLLALIILVNQYKKATEAQKEEIYQFYLNNLEYVNNWNLVDVSAHDILGLHIFTKDKYILLELARSNVLWKRRIAIVATWYFIRQNEFEWCFKISKMLLSDSHDLIHKAVGWMLREVGKKNISVLKQFLNKHIFAMPRTTLRYAIEKFPESQRQEYLQRKY